MRVFKPSRRYLAQRLDLIACREFMHTVSGDVPPPGRVERGGVSYRVPYKWPSNLPVTVENIRWYENEYVHPALRSVI